MDQLWSIWDEVFKVPGTDTYSQSLGRESTPDKHRFCPSRQSSAVPVDGVNGQDGISAHVAVTVLQTGPDGRHERLQQLWLLQFAQETQRGATDELVGMLQVLKPQYQYHHW